MSLSAVQPHGPCASSKSTYENSIPVFSDTSNTGRMFFLLFTIKIKKDCKNNHSHEQRAVRLSRARQQQCGLLRCPNDVLQARSGLYCFFLILTKGYSRDGFAQTACPDFHSAWISASLTDGDSTRDLKKTPSGANRLG